MKTVYLDWWHGILDPSLDRPVLCHSATELTCPQSQLRWVVSAVDRKPLRHIRVKLTLGLHNLQKKALLVNKYFMSQLWPKKQQIQMHIKSLYGTWPLKYHHSAFVGDFTAQMQCFIKSLDFRTSSDMPITLIDNPILTRNVDYHYIMSYNSWKSYARSHTIIKTFFVAHHPPQSQPCWIWACFTLFPLSVWQEIVFHERQTCEQQIDSLSKTKLLWQNNTYRQKLYVIV